MCPELSIAGPQGGGELRPRIFGAVVGAAGDPPRLLPAGDPLVPVPPRLAVLSLHFQKPIELTVCSIVCIYSVCSCFTETLITQYKIWAFMMTSQAET
jgi:hypothetical protein